MCVCVCVCEHAHLRYYGPGPDWPACASSDVPLARGVVLPAGLCDSEATVAVPRVRPVQHEVPVAGPPRDSERPQ